MASRKVDDLDERKKVEQRGLVVHDLELAAFAGGELEERDFRPREPERRDRFACQMVLIFHQIASFRFITVQ